MAGTQHGRRWTAALVGLLLGAFGAPGLASAAPTTASAAAPAGATAQASAAAPGRATAQASPAAPGSYRHGVVPMLGTAAPSTASSGGNLLYQGGNDGVGVTTGAPKVYLVFWGSQWGLAATGPGPGGQSFGGDADGVAPVLERFFQGLGTDSETWSGVVTQYCEGIAAGTSTCPTTAAHVATPGAGTTLAGLWGDNSGAAPASATAHQLAAEAVAAAAHFGNTTAAANRDAQYVIVSPSGTDPDQYQEGGFCAWHDWSADPSLDGGGAVASAVPVAFTNLPYLPDAGGSCGMNFVNGGSAGLLDGVTLVGGHEYAETLTDQFPAGGWLDSQGNEIADKCAWIASGQGASQDITLSTGTFPVQSLWGDDFNGGAGGCEISHPAVTSTGTAPAIASANHVTFAAGSGGSFQVTTTGSPAPALSETGSLPSGVTFVDNHDGTGTLSATTAATAGGTYPLTIRATNGVGTGATQAFTLTIGTAPAVTSAASATFPVGVGGTFSVSASGFPAPTVTETGTLPAGVTFAAASRTLSGTPAAGTVGTYPVTFTASNGVGAAAVEAFTLTVDQATFTYPTNGQTAVDTTKAFTWSRIPEAQGYIVVIGTTQYGSNLAASTILGAGQSSYNLATALPTGSTLYATLFAEVNSQWGSYQGISFTAAPGQASFTSPGNGQSGVDPTKALAWSTIPGAQGYLVAVGTSQYGTNVALSTVLPPTQSSYATSVLPANKTLYATLFTEVDGAWTRFQSIVFTTGAAMATFTHPTQGQAGVTTPGAFAWNTLAGAQNYDLVIGTTMFGSNLVSSGLLAPTTSSFAVPALPAGKSLYATLLTEVNGVWSYQVVVFSAG